jgi:glycosyltransferase involved in cell wall biosynthesis
VGDDGRIRIALVSGAPYAGGAEKYLSLLASGLDRQKYDPFLIIPGLTSMEDFRKEAEGFGLRTETLGREPFSFINSAIQFRNLIRSESPDIVHINMPGPFDCGYGLAATLARLAGTKRIVTTDHLPMVKSFPKARLLRSFNLRHVDRFITVSEDNRNHMRKGHGVPEDKIRVVYNGIPDPGPVEENPISDDGPVELLLAGALEERKGTGVLISAMEKLPGRVRLTVAGEGPMRGELEAAAARLGGNRITLTGRVADIDPLLRKAHILVVPSFMEATPYVILEAMAAGRPVVASDIFGIPEQVLNGVTGLLCEPGSPESVASTVMRLVSGSGLAGRMGSEGRRRYEEMFTIERSAAGTTVVYDELF